MRWGEFAAEEPEFAAEVRRRLEARKHNYLATIRADGSPRIGGTEIAFSKDGADLWIGAMPKSRKVLDLLNDPRFALHGASDDPPVWDGDAKVAGTMIPASTDQARALLDEYGFPPDKNGMVFLADLSEAVLTRLGDPQDHLDISLWKAGAHLRTMRVE
jgi:hypothetical protein